MPDDYYVSKYSGEEIDERLTAAHNAVRYDAAQTLTDAQKRQARANIAAAPDGFGLGLRNVRLTSSDNLDNVTGNGWYSWGSPAPANAPALINVNPSPDYCAMFMIGSSQIVVSSNDRNNMAMRTKNIDGWTPWEYINPPLKLGVEYRTTERYLGKPVYAMAVNCGSAPSNSLKKFDTGLDYTVIDRRLTPTGNMYANSNDNFSIPCESTNVVAENLNIAHGTYVDSGGVRHDAIFIYTTSTALTGYTVYVVLKYTKTTD